jgi:hypothetical protein
MIKYGVMKIIGEEVIEACVKVIFQNSPEGIGKKQ